MKVSQIKQLLDDGYDWGQITDMEEDERHASYEAEAQFEEDPTSTKEYS